MLLFQNLEGQTSYKDSELSLDRTEEAIQYAKDGVDYSDELGPRKKKKESNKARKGSQSRVPKVSPKPTGAVPLIAKVLLLILGVGLIGFIIYSLVKGQSLDTSTLEKDKETEEFAKLNLRDPLQEELGKGNYRLACRILYLQMLQELVKLRAILWRNEKTNWDYYQEAIHNKRVNSKSLHAITDRYDLLWYGEKEPSLAEFNQFQDLINHFKS